jgi:hypothetical protein
MFTESDFDLPQNDADSEREKRIELLRQELRFLNTELNVNSQMQGLIGGSAVGYALGMGAIGVGLGAILGYNLAKGKPISPELRQQIKIAIARKKSELKALESRGEVERAEMSGVMTSEQMMQYEYRELPFSGKWEAFIGKPAANFHALIWGKPKMGKSYLAVAFAKYLSNFGSVLYIAGEEGFSATLKKKIQDFGLTNSNVEFANFKTPESILTFLQNNSYDFIIIDSVNFVRMTPEQVEQAKDIAPDSGFITVQQATKQGQARGSMEFAHNADIIIEVIEGVAYAQGRFAPPSEMPIFDRPEPQFMPKNEPSNERFPDSGQTIAPGNDPGEEFDVNDFAGFV